MQDYRGTILEEQYEDYVVECEAALRVTMAKINNLREVMKRSTRRNPFSSVAYRIKTFDSVIEKCARRNYEPTIESIRVNVLDVAGIRIITPFEDDIANVVEILHHIPGFNVEYEKDYVTTPKANGYRSYHMRIRVETYDPITGGTKLVPIEIQVRDKAMDLWATVEHIVKYKNDDPSPEVGEQFKHIAEILIQFDRKAIELRDFSSEDAGLHQSAESLTDRQ